MLVALTAGLSHAQGYIPSAWDLIAHYPLTSDANDATGNNNPINMLNAPFVDGAVFMNGIYNDGTPGACQVWTDNLDAINLRSVAASIEFKTDSVRTGVVLNISTTHRLTSVWLDPDSTIGFSTNIGSIVPTSFSITPGKWHEAAIVMLNDSVRLYIDSVFAVSIKTPDVTNADKRVNLDNGSSGVTFFGSVRNLKIHSGVLTATANNVDEIPDAEFKVSVFPNPATSSSRLIVDAERSGTARISLHDILGRAVTEARTVELNPGSNEVGSLSTAAGFAPGLYALRVNVDGIVSTKILTITR